VFVHKTVSSICNK